jgi:hypothetical protein
MFHATMAWYVPSMYQYNDIVCFWYIYIVIYNKCPVNNVIEVNSFNFFAGYVTRLLSGIDGTDGAKYEVEYDGYESAFEVDHLLEDYLEGSLKFL